MENTLNYSDEWQPYIGYDKFEYDIKLIDGTILENCYPNAGEFEDLRTRKTASESEVIGIRFSQNPVTALNIGVSTAKTPPPTDPYMEAMHRAGNIDFILEEMHRMETRKPKWARGYKVEAVRTEPKIGNNRKCTCGSGIKYKRCCKKNLKHC